jgi:hypothetical protein
MGQVLHGCATTTEAIRRAIQNSQESLRALATRYGINAKTVAKWKKRGFGENRRLVRRSPRPYCPIRSSGGRGCRRSICHPAIFARNAAREDYVNRA